MLPERISSQFCLPRQKWTAVLGERSAGEGERSGQSIRLFLKLLKGAVSLCSKGLCVRNRSRAIRQAPQPLRQFRVALQDERAQYPHQRNTKRGGVRDEIVELEISKDRAIRDLRVHNL